MKNISRKQQLAEIAGWYGAVAILGAYTLVSFSVLQADNIIYQLLNLTGALGVLAIALYKKVHQSVVINLFWATVALIALVALIV